MKLKFNDATSGVIYARDGIAAFVLLTGIFILSYFI